MVDWLGCGGGRSVPQRQGVRWPGRGGSGRPQSMATRSKPGSPSPALRAVPAPLKFAGLLALRMLKALARCPVAAPPEQPGGGRPHHVNHRNACHNEPWHWRVVRLVAGGRRPAGRSCANPRRLPAMPNLSEPARVQASARSTDNRESPLHSALCTVRRAPCVVQFAPSQRVGFGHALVGHSTFQTAGKAL